MDFEEIQIINENVQDFQNNQLIERRKNNVYEQIIIKGSKIEKAVEALMSEHLDKPFAFESFEEKLFTDYIELYQNRRLKKMLMIVYEGYVFIINPEEMELQVKPFNFLREMNKVVYSEIYDTMLALKLRDMSKFDNRDHVVLCVNERRLLVDFFLEYADKMQDEVIFEQNEEFNMIVSLSPVWFSFQDVDQSRKEQALLLKNSKFDIKGFLEVKENSAINIFKSLFKGSKAKWENKYCVLKGVKLYIY